MSSHGASSRGRGASAPTGPAAAAPRMPEDRDATVSHGTRRGGMSLPPLVLASHRGRARGRGLRGIRGGRGMAPPARMSGSNNLGPSNDNGWGRGSIRPVDSYVPPPPPSQSQSSTSHHKWESPPVTSAAGPSNYASRPSTTTNVVHSTFPSSDISLDHPVTPPIEQRSTPPRPSTTRPTTTDSDARRPKPPPSRNLPSTTDTADSKEDAMINDESSPAPPPVPVKSTSIFTPAPSRPAASSSKSSMARPIVMDEKEDARGDDVKPDVRSPDKGKQKEVVVTKRPDGRTDGGYIPDDRNDGVMVMWPDQIPDCFAHRDPGKRSTARKAFRAQQESDLKAKGISISKVMWRDDGVGVHWERMAQARSKPTTTRQAVAEGVDEARPRLKTKPPPNVTPISITSSPPPATPRPQQSMFPLSPSTPGSPAPPRPYQTTTTSAPTPAPLPKPPAPAPTPSTVERAPKIKPDPSPREPKAKTMKFKPARPPIPPAPANVGDEAPEAGVGEEPKLSKKERKRLNKRKREEAAEEEALNSRSDSSAKRKQTPEEKERQRRAEELILEKQNRGQLPEKKKKRKDKEKDKEKGTPAATATAIPSNASLPPKPPAPAPAGQDSDSPKPVKAKRIVDLGATSAASSTTSGPRPLPPSSSALSSNSSLAVAPPHSRNSSSIANPIKPYEPPSIPSYSSTHNTTSNQGARPGSSTASIFRPPASVSASSNGTAASRPFDLRPSSPPKSSVPPAPKPAAARPPASAPKPSSPPPSKPLTKTAPTAARPPTAKPSSPPKPSIAATSTAVRPRPPAPVPSAAAGASAVRPTSRPTAPPRPMPASAATAATSGPPAPARPALVFRPNMPARPRPPPTGPRAGVENGPRPPTAAGADSTVPRPRPRPMMSRSVTPSNVSARYDDLKRQLGSKMVEMDNWTSMLTDMPDRVELTQRQIARTREECFDLQKQMREERERTGR